ncbi:MAG: ATP-dependent helicase/nuclease subunit A [Verrucomicrobiales bacterium]
MRRGGEGAIWPHGCEWLQTPPEPSDAAAKLIAAVESDSRYTATAVKAWKATAQDFAKVTPKQRLEKLTGLNAHLLANSQDLRAGNAIVKIRKDYELTVDQCRHAYALMHHVMHCEVTAAQQRTRGIWQILDTFERAYDREIRSTGKLTFDDVQRLLAGVRPLSQKVESDAVDDDVLLHIGYRLDARFHHWMLDEFQDTSRVQWRVLQNLIDEAVTHGDATERSLFYVGDVKQSIYGWRGGDHRLFQEIANHYNQGSEDVVHKVPRSTSYRCSKPVIDTVNQVFGDIQVLKEFCSDNIASRWESVWKKHSTAVDAPGYATFISTPRPEKARGKLTAPDDRHFAMVLGLIEEVDPLARGLTCAILVRRNPDGDKVATYIRQNSTFEVEREAVSQPVVDNALGSAFLSLFKAAAYPSDTFSWQHLQLTPFRQCFEHLEWSQDTFLRETLKAIHQHGFEHVIRQWLDRLQVVLEAQGSPLDAFSQRRATSLCDAASEFDAGAAGNTGRDPSKFIAFLEGYTEREAASDGRIQVMTVHKAKGLEFDMVIVLELGNSDFKSIGKKSFTTSLEEEEVFHASHDHTGGLRWALDIPRKTIAEADPVLRQSLEEKSNDQCYENICLTYVAMTRAKHGLYLIADEIGKSSKSFNFGRYLQETLGNMDNDITVGSSRSKGTRRFETANSQWFTEVVKKAPSEAPATQAKPPQPIHFRAVTKPDLPTLKPSGHSEAVPGKVPAAPEAHPSADQSLTAQTQPGYAFLKHSRKSSEAMAYGTAVHALFEQIYWLEDFADEAAIRSHWDQSVPMDPSFINCAYDEVLACLQQPEIADLLQRKNYGENPILWREGAFSQIVDGQLLNGVFDRVVIKCDGRGHPAAATIIDFKTDKVRTSEEIEAATFGHRLQMNAYREALAKLFGLPIDSIATVLIFSQRPQMVLVSND